MSAYRVVQIAANGRRHPKTPTITALAAARGAKRDLERAKPGTSYGLDTKINDQWEPYE